MTSALRQPKSPPKAATDIDVELLAEAIAAINRRTRRELALPIGVSAVSALRTVLVSGPIKLGDLALHEGVTPATLSRIVATLEEQGYVTRRASMSDRRSASLVATADGRKLIDRIRRDRGNVIRTRVDSLTPAQRRALHAALPALAALAEG